MKRIGSVMVALALLLCLAACGSDVVGEQSGGGEALTTGKVQCFESGQKIFDALLFSYEGLVKQLEFEKYTLEDAVFAVEHCGVDWNEQAAKRRKAICAPALFLGWTD